MSLASPALAGVFFATSTTWETQEQSKAKILRRLGEMERKINPTHLF